MYRRLVSIQQTFGRTVERPMQISHYLRSHFVHALPLPQSTYHPMKYICHQRFTKQPTHGQMLRIHFHSSWIVIYLLALKEEIHSLFRSLFLWDASRTYLNQSVQWQLVVKVLTRSVDPNDQVIGLNNLANDFKWPLLRLEFTCRWKIKFVQNFEICLLFSW